MFILINETRHEINEYGVQRNKITGQLVLTVKMPKESATAVQMDELCTLLKETAPDIVVYNDNEEVVQTLKGFALEPVFGLTKFGTWELIVENKSELEYQYQMLVEENEALKAQTQTLEEQNMFLTDCLVEMSMIVYA